MSFTYSMSGYEFGTRTLRNGMWLVRGTEYAPALTSQVPVVEVPTVPYDIPQWQVRLSPITVGMTFRIKGADGNDLRDQWDMLMGLAGMGTNAPVVMTRNRSGATENADAQFMSSTAPDFDCPRHLLDLQMIMNIPGGAWRGPQTDQNFNTAQNQPINTANASNRPIADALIRTAGPLSSLTVTDTVSGTAVHWGGGTTTVPSGQFLLIEVSTMRAALLPTATWDVSAGTQVSAILTFRGNGPLTLTSRRTGFAAEPTSGLTIARSGGTGVTTVRSRPAVV